MGDPGAIAGLKTGWRYLATVGRAWFGATALKIPPLHGAASGVET